MDAKLLKMAERLMTLAMFVQVVIVALENWTLHRRVRKLEARLGLK
jgi:hypothetical protein